jgi:NADH-quinone oxidoreductase subunit J
MKVALYVLAAWTITTGLLAITMRNMVHCALALIAFFAGIAGVFFTLRAEFLGAVQIIVYIGAVAVLILFAIMLTRNVTGQEGTSPFSIGWAWGWLTSLALLGIIIYSIQGLNVPIAAAAEPARLTVSQIGESFMRRYAVAFEVISLLLTAALVAAVVIALEEPKAKD